MAPLMVFERLEDVTDGDEALACEIVDLFTDTTATYLQRLKEAFEADTEDWPAAAHALKGCCSNFGAAALAEVAKACEAEEPSQNRLTELSQIYGQTCKLLATRYQPALL